MNHKKSQEQPEFRVKGHESHPNRQGEERLEMAIFEQQFLGAPMTTPVQDAFFVGSGGRSMPTMRVDRSIVKAAESKGRGEKKEKPEYDEY